MLPIGTSYVTIESFLEETVKSIVRAMIFTCYASDSVPSDSLE